MQEAQQQFNQLNIDVIVVTFDSADYAQRYREQFNLQWPILIDSDQALYRSYQFPKADLWKLANPVAIMKYVKLIATGSTMGPAGKDIKQLGGDILIDPDGFVRMHYISQDALDRPSPETIISRVDALQMN